jgi:predicted Fe-Mo cluster-binding NifX family protein
MILAVPLEKETHRSPIAKQFARAKYYAIVDKERSSMEIIPNPCLGMSAQAGKCTILYLTTRKNVNTLVAYELGHNVQQISLKQNIQLILINERRKNLDQLTRLMNFKIEE